MALCYNFDAMKSDLKRKFNSEQLSAIEYNKGPLLIIAGAGTGKTTVITEKVKYLVTKKGVRPHEILALTFTEKAASEMEERVDEELPYGYFQMWISTFHSFADKVLREEAPQIGLTPSYKLMTDAETILFLRKNLFLFKLKYFRPLGNPHKFLESLVDHFSRLRDENISPESYYAWATSSRSMITDKKEMEKYRELARAYKKYQELKIKEGVFDFADLMYYLLILFKKRKNILKKYQNQFKYVMIDEFQDTNIVQYEFIKYFSPPQNNPKLTVVGDDSQAIYKFRGASISNILTLKRDYRVIKQITLRKNYRSYQEILDASYKLIQHNNPDTLESQLGISKKLASVRSDPKRFDGAHRKLRRRIASKVEFSSTIRVEEEADYVATQIKNLISGGNYAFSDFAILVRANNHADPFARALSQRGIPFQFLGPGMLFKQPEVKDLIAYLTFLSDIEDSVSLYRVLSMDILDIDRKDLASIVSFAHKTALSLFQAIEILIGLSLDEFYQEDFGVYKKYVPRMQKKTREKLVKLYKMTNSHLASLRKETAGQLLYYFLESTGYLDALANFKSVKEEKISLNVSKFFDRIKRYELEHEDTSVFAAVDFIKMSMELGESPLASYEDIALYNAVNILTVHSAKGLEFPVVFLVNLTQERFPTREQKEKIPIPTGLIKEILPASNPHLLEERRLFYVGLTRAKDHVFMTSAQYYAGGKRERRISPFVVETLGEKAVTQALLKRDEQKKQLAMFEYKKTPEQLSGKEDAAPTKFSFSQLETYMLCPLRYKYQYILRVPTPSGAAASFGTSIHSALQLFYQKVINKGKPTIDDLLSGYKTSWVPVGYLSKSHESRMKKEGKRMLANYFKTFHGKGTKVLDVERSFNIKVDGTLITGKIDRVDKKGNDELEIIDYKTGKKPDEKKLRDSLQLSIYLMAASDKSLYAKPANKVHLTFYYLQEPSKITMQKTAQDVTNVKEKIKEIVGKIKKQEFTPHVGPWCDFCPFRMVCEAWQ